MSDEIAAAFREIAGTDKIGIKLVEASVGEKDPANVHIQGNRKNNVTVKFGMFAMVKNAQWMCDRILRKECYPGGTITFKANRATFRAEPGDPYRILYAPYGLDGAYRIVKITEESPMDETLSFTAVEDVYYAGVSLPELTASGSPNPWEP